VELSVDPVLLVSDGRSAVGAATARRARGAGFRVAVNVPGGPAPRDWDYGAALEPWRPGTAEALVDAVRERLGRLDAVALTGDVLVPVTVESGDEQVVRRVVHEIAKAAFCLTQAAARAMDVRAGGQGGALVYVGSVHDEKPTGLSFAYAAAMGALKMLSREAALDLGRRGIRVNLVEAGALAGDGSRFASPLSDVYTDYDRKVPLPTGPGQPEDVADAVLWLLGDGARFVNGAEMRVDGGFTLHYMDHKMRRD
jgi:glucose 1-dehydrogenase